MNVDCQQYSMKFQFYLTIVFRLGMDCVINIVHIFLFDIFFITFLPFYLFTFHLGNCL